MALVLSSLSFTVKASKHSGDAVEHLATSILLRCCIYDIFRFAIDMSKNIFGAVATMPCSTSTWYLSAGLLWAASTWNRQVVLWLEEMVCLLAKCLTARAITHVALASSWWILLFMIMTGFLSAAPEIITGFRFTRANYFCFRCNLSAAASNKGCSQEHTCLQAPRRLDFQVMVELHYL